MELSLNWNRIELEPIANWYWIGAELILHRYSSGWENVLGFKGIFSLQTKRISQKDTRRSDFLIEPVEFRSGHTHEFV